MDTSDAFPKQDFFFITCKHLPAYLAFQITPSLTLSALKGKHMACSRVSHCLPTPCSCFFGSMSSPPSPDTLLNSHRFPAAPLCPALCQLLALELAGRTALLDRICQTRQSLSEVHRVVSGTACRSVPSYILQVPAWDAEGPHLTPWVTNCSLFLPRKRKTCPRQSSGRSPLCPISTAISAPVHRGAAGGEQKEGVG